MVETALRLVWGICVDVVAISLGLSKIKAFDVFFWRSPQDCEPHLRTAEVAEASSLNLMPEVRRLEGAGRVSRRGECTLTLEGLPIRGPQEAQAATLSICNQCRRARELQESQSHFGLTFC